MSEYLGCNTFDYFGIDEGDVLLRLNRDRFQAVIVSGRLEEDGTTITGGFTLAWTDYVANHWGEHYDDLATAIARLAVLEFSIQEFDGEKGFADQPEPFTDRARTWFDRALT